MTKAKIYPKGNEKNEESKDSIKSKKSKKAFNIEKALYIIIGTFSLILDIPLIQALIIVILVVLFANAISGTSKTVNLDSLSFLFIKIICLFIIIADTDNPKILRITGIIMLITIIIEIIVHKQLFLIN